MQKNPIYGCDSIEWKRCQTNKQACVWCGHMMDKSYIDLQLKGVKGKTKVNLWVHGGCMYYLGECLEMPTPQLYCGRISKWRPNGERNCLFCDKKIRKSKEAVAWQIDNSNDDIKTVKTLVFHESCRQKLADGFKNPNF